MKNNARHTLRLIQYYILAQLVSMKSKFGKIVGFPSGLSLHTRRDECADERSTAAPSHLTRPTFISEWQNQSVCTKPNHAPSRDEKTYSPSPFGASRS